MEAGEAAVCSTRSWV